MTVPTIRRHRGQPRIAVLPMRQYLTKPIADQITNRITADIISHLATVRELTVISYYLTFGLTAARMDTYEIGQELDARYLVTCGVHYVDDKFRMTTTVIESETGAVSSPFDDHVDPTLSSEDQDRIVGRAVNQVIAQIREAELRRVRRRRPKVLSAYEKLLLSRQHITFLDRVQFDETIRVLNEVIEADPGNGEVYALAAEWHGAIVGEYWSTDRAAEIETAEPEGLSPDAPAKASPR
jgi:TolB-like protein